VRVPKSVKRFLTTLQIAQFIWGASYAAIHLFVQYDIPIATPYKVLATVSSVAASATSAVASATSEVSKVVESPAATASIGALIKKLLLRAAGEEGIAERVGIPHDNKPVSQHIEERMEQLHHHVVPAGPQYETKWRTEWTKVNCIDTSGEAFAIYLNLFYLFPLTVLFARFFYKAYMKRTSRPRGASQNAKAIAQDARTAERETEKAVEAAGKRAEDQVRNSGAKAQEKTRDLAKELREDVQKFKEGGKFQSRRVSQAIENFEQKVQQTADSIGDAASPTSTPKKSSPKKKNNKKNRQGGDDSRPSTPQKSNEPDVKDDLAPKVDLKPEDGDAGADAEKSDAPEPSDKENQPPATPDRKQKKNSQPKKEEDDQQSSTPDLKQSKDSQSKKDEEEQQSSTPDRKQSKNTQSKKEDRQASNNSDRKQAKNSQSKKDESDADDSQSGLLSPSKKGDKPTAETSKVPAEDESAEKQDANLEASEPTRPAPEDDATDALSQSASFINYSELSGDSMKLSEYEDEPPAKSTA
jgi:F0F1-type ATP synthase membrane subunit b/b'